MKQLRLTGSGGQGIITMAIILAEGAVQAGYHAVQTQAYGPEARGGASKAEVIISKEDIAYPKVRQPNIVLAMNQEGCDKYSGGLRKDDLLIVDETFVKILPNTEAKIIALPITTCAREKLGKELFSNIIALGVLGKAMQLLDKETLEKAVLARVPKGTEEKNSQAFAIGWDLL